MTKPIVVRTRGLLFDMDGVLISSIGSVNRSWRLWARRYGIPNPDTYQVPHGQRAIDIVRSLRPDIDPSEGLQVIEEIELADNEGLQVLPGVRDLLASLPADRWAIVTSATRPIVLSRLSFAGLPLPGRIVSAEDVTLGKPNPEPYRRGAELLGLSPTDCLVVEDAPSGVGAGQAAGSRVLGVLGTHTAAELAQATWILPTLTGLHVAAEPDGLVLHLPPGSEPTGQAEAAFISA